MFDLREYILKLLDGAIGKEPDYKVRELALGWYDKSVLVEADLQAVDSLIEARQESQTENTTEEIPEEVVEEIIDENAPNEETTIEQSEEVIEE